MSTLQPFVEKRVESYMLTLLLQLCLEIGYLFNVTANLVYVPTGRLLVESEQDWTKEKENIV